MYRRTKFLRQFTTTTDLYPPSSEKRIHSFLFLYTSTYEVYTSNLDIHEFRNCRLAEFRNEFLEVRWRKGFVDAVLVAGH